MITLIIPTFGGSPSNIRRTIESCAGLADDVVVISTCPYQEDVEELKKMATVVELLWNHTYLHGFGDMMNRGTDAAKNDWLLLFGVGETLLRPHQPIHLALRNAPRDMVFLCDHANDPHKWGRVWNRRGGTRWGGLIHESIGGGQQGGLLFEMRDTPKDSTGSSEKDAVFRHIKATLYNAMYLRLLQHPEQLGHTDPGWLNFVRGAQDDIEGFCRTNGDLLDSAMAGDFSTFSECVAHREPATGVNFRPLGEPHGD